MDMLRQAQVALSGLMLMSGAAVADQGDVILEVTGQIADGPAALDRATLQTLPSVTINTSTVVTDGVHAFSGVLMRDLLDSLDAQGDQVMAIALNEYAVDIPMSDFYDYDVILATTMDGKELTRDDKGPLWIVYPRDDHEALQDIRYDYRWVWQLSRLDVR
ncbi:MAG TPA: molybdopterin-dependent oxidoreductase [Roseovarius sp.]